MEEKKFKYSVFLLCITALVLLSYGALVGYKGGRLEGSEHFYMIVLCLHHLPITFFTLKRWKCLENYKFRMCEAPYKHFTLV